MSLSESASDDDGSVSWQQELQAARIHIVSRMEYKKISAGMRADMIFDQEDDEEIKNQHLNPTTNSQTNKMVDKLLRKGEENYHKFLDIIEYRYPDLYQLITGKPATTGLVVPPDVVPKTPIPTNGTEADIMSILIERLDTKKQECEDLVRRNLMTERLFEDKSREFQMLQSKVQELQMRSERYDSMERDMAALKEVVDQVKNENYKVCMRLVDTNEENSRLREHNMAMRVENDKAKVEIRKMESTVNSERSVSVRLRKKLETGPTVKSIHALQQEIDNLKLKLAQSDQRTQYSDNDIDTRLQILQGDKEEAIQMYAEATEKLNKLRDEFNSTETLRDKYLEESERLQLQVSALTDDCEMYKTRQDAVWQQLQEVEKERDQLMKERNEAQMSAQNHMDEKTKYRALIRKLEEEHDRLSHQLREKENELRLLSNRRRPSMPPELPIEEESRNGTETTSSISDQAVKVSEQRKPSQQSEWECRRFRVHNVKHYPEFLTKSEFATSPNPNVETKTDKVFPEILLASNYGTNCGKYSVSTEYPQRPTKEKRRAMRIKGNRNDSRQANVGSITRRTIDNLETRSRTSSSESPHQRWMERDDSCGNLIEIDAETVQKCVKFIGGNQSGIFVNQIVESQDCPQPCSSLQPGMKVMKICSPKRRPVKVRHWSLEYTNDIIHNLEGTLSLYTELRQKEYQDLKDTMRNSRNTGDSFYVRANFKWNIDEMLSFTRYEVLHVISTQPSAEMQWLACKIDPYNGNNASKCDVIPSYKYCLKNPLQQDSVLTKGRRFTEPNLFPMSNNRKEISNPTLSVKLPSPQKPCFTQLVIGRAETSYDPVGQPYTLVRPVPSAKDKSRPCLFLPQSLSKILSFKLTTIAEPLLFDLPVPESVNCTVNSARSRLYDREVVSFNSISDDMQEIVSTNAVQKTANMGKHCILSINENCISIKEYLRKLQEEDIYPIVIFLHAEKQRTVKLFIEEDKSRPNIVIQDMILTGEQLKRFACSFVTVKLDRCSRVEDAVQFIMEKVADETNRIVWREEEKEICI